MHYSSDEVPNGFLQKKKNNANIIKFGKHCTYNEISFIDF